MAHGAHDHHEHDHHDHGHGHGGHHHHAPANMGRAFAIGVILNIGFVAAEVGAGLWTGSLALLADAGHNLSDVLALLLAWGATILARPRAGGPPHLRPAQGHHPGLAGQRRPAAGGGGGDRLGGHPPLRPARALDARTVMLVAGLGVLINGATALLFMRGSQSDLNVRGAFLHMAADAAVSLTVVVGAVVIMTLTGVHLDRPGRSAWSSRPSSCSAPGACCATPLDLAMDAAPRGIDVDEVRAVAGRPPGVEDVHDLHIWAMSTTETALTAHVLRPRTPTPTTSCTPPATAWPTGSDRPRHPADRDRRRRPRLPPRPRRGGVSGRATSLLRWPSTARPTALLEPLGARPASRSRPARQGRPRPPRRAAGPRRASAPDGPAGLAARRQRRRDRLAAAAGRTPAAASGRTSPCWSPPAP